MRDELRETLILGAGIGLAVVAIRALTNAGPGDSVWWALALAGVGLCALQFVLSLRHTRQPGTKSDQDEERPVARPDKPKRPSWEDAFAQERNPNWTGLNDHVPPQTAVQPSESSESAANAAEESGKAP